MKAGEVHDLAKKLFPQDQNVQLERARFLGINGQVRNQVKKNLRNYNILKLLIQLKIYITRLKFIQNKIILTKQKNWHMNA